MTPLLRVAAIDFLNPAPLMWDFEHSPRAGELAARYAIEKMSPAACAVALATGNADLGLIPAGAYATIPGLAIVPGCAIASLGAIRSLLLVLRADASAAHEREPAPGDAPDFDPPTRAELDRMRTVALDTASRTSALYMQILFRRFWGRTPRFIAQPAALESMLASADAALLIGDPALHALADREDRLARTGERLRYLDLAHLWHAATGTAWVSAFWAVRLSGLTGLSVDERRSIVRDLQQSRDAGLRHIPELVEQWAPRLNLRPSTVTTYLTRNIHYQLDAPAIAGLERFYAEAHALELIPQLPRLDWFAP